MSKRPSGVRADHAYSYQKLERVAAQVRKDLGFSPTAAIDALELFEGLDDLLVYDANKSKIPLRCAVIDLEGSEGFARYDDERNVIEVCASALTYEWLENDHPRAVYFVAHELGHCVLHTDQLVRLAQMPTLQQAAFHRESGVVVHEAYRDTEWQANAFASALLMPARGLRLLEEAGEHLTPSGIADQFGVSVEAAGYRLGLYQQKRAHLLYIPAN